jgi:hypothetical protein
VDIAILILGLNEKIQDAKEDGIKRARANNIVYF